MADIVKGKIGNALMSVAPDGIVATADAIYDETKGKSQEQINEDTKQSLAEQANNIGYYECGTAAATATKEITGGSYKLPEAAPYGGTIKVKFTYKNSAANPTLSINGSPAKPLYYNGAIASLTNTWEDGDVLDLYYDGTNFNARSVVEKFATGEKVKNIGIDSEPTAESDNLVKSEGVNSRSLNTMLVGAGTDAVSSTIIGLQSGHTYIIIPSQLIWDISELSTLTTGNSVFLVRTVNQDNTYNSIQSTNNTIASFTNNGLTADSYIVTIPSDKKNELNFYIRANTGTKLRFSVYDITYVNNNFISTSLTQSFTDAEKNKALSNLGMKIDDVPIKDSTNLIRNGAVSRRLLNNVIIGNNNNPVFTRIDGVKPGNTYLCIPSQTTWDISGVTVSESNNVFWGTYENLEGTVGIIQGVQVNKGGFSNGIADYYIFTLPSDSKNYLEIGIRATKNIKLEFSLYDVTYITEVNKNYEPLPLDLYGVDNYSFSLGRAGSGSMLHIEDLDIHRINIKAGETLTGIITLAGGATLSESTHTYRARIYYKDGTHLDSSTYTYDTESTNTFSITATKEVIGIGFNIRNIYTTGICNVQLQKPNSVDSTLQFITEQIPSIPSYFNTNIEEVVESSRRDMSTIGLTGDNFIFITDIHWESNYKHSPVIINKLCKELNIDKIVFGGDAINGQANQDTAMQMFAEISGGLRDSLSKNFVAVMGNHDYNGADGGTIFAKPQSTFYSIFNKNLDYKAVHGSDVYYYFDNPTTNTRFIVLETGRSYSIALTQSDWLAQVINDSGDKNIIIFLHTYLRENAVYDESEVYIGYNYGTSSAGEKVQTIVDAAIQNGKHIQAIIAGHTHLDYNYMTNSMVPIVVTDCDGRHTTMWEPVTIGTKKEQAFDVVTIDYTEKTIKCRRVGRGKSRIIHYDVNNLAIGNTLDISSELEITPTSYSIRDNGSLQYRNAAGGGTGVTFNGTIASIASGVITPISTGLCIAVAENDDCIETFNIKIS